VSSSNLGGARDGTSPRPGGTPGSRAPGDDVGRSVAVRFFGAAITLRASVLAIDARPRFFLGDSESYLSTAVGGWMPNDRSWLYGLAVNLLLRASHALSSVIAVQTLCSAALCAAVAVACRRLGVRSWIAWCVLVALSLEPMLLYYDRSIMTDAPGTAAVTLGVLAAGAMMLDGRSSWPAAVGLLAALVLRTALVPLVLWVPAFALARALVAARDRSARWAGARRAAALLGVVLAGVVVYAAATGAVTRSPPSLNPRGGYFLLGVVAPILAPQDFEGRGVRDAAGLLAESRHRELPLRNWQVFGPGGLASHLDAALGDWRKVSRAGTLLARRSIVRDPVGFAALALGQGAEYLSVGPYRARFAAEFGLDRPLSASTVDALRSKVSHPVDAGLPWRPSPVLSALHLAVAWPPVLCWLAVLSPALALACVGRVAESTRSFVLLVATSTWLYLASVWALSPELVPRYLLPLAPMTAVLVAVAIDAALRRQITPARESA
jgi:hypothetical protein